MSDINKYDKELIGKISNTKNWPGITNVPFILHLLQIANKQIKNKTVEGVLSATLIYQQVMEELILNLLKVSHLYVQAEIWPSRINFPINKKMMFGQLLDAHKLSIDFDMKQELIKEAKEFNELRVKFVHKLVHTKGPSEIIDSADDVYTKFQTILDLFYQAREHLDRKLHDLYSRVDFNDLIDESENLNN